MQRTAAIRALVGTASGVPRLVARVLIAAALAGCSGTTSGLYLHNETASKTIGEIAEKQAQIGSLGPTTTARANQQAFLTADLALVGQRARVYRDAEIVSLVGRDEPLVRTAVAKIEGRIAELVLGDSVEATRRLAALEATSADLKDQQRLFRSVLRIDGPACDHTRTGTAGAEPKGGFDPSDPALIAKTETAAKAAGTNVMPDKGGVDVRTFLGGLAEACGALIDEFSTQSSGLLGDAAGEVVAAEAKRAKARETAGEQKTAFHAAAKAYADALKAQTPQSDDAIREKAEKAKATLDEMLNGNPIAKTLVSKAMIGKIDTVLESITGTASDDEAAATSGTGAKPDAGTVLAESFVPLAGKLEALAKLHDAKPLVPLLLEKQRLENLKDSAARAVERDDRQLGLLQERQEMLKQEYLALVNARATLKHAATLPGGAAMTGTGLAKTANPDARVDVIRGLQTYLATYVGPRQRLDEIAFELVDLDHQRVIDANEAAFRAQDTLIGTSVGALKDNLEGGFRSEEVSNLLQSIFLALIAVGVN